MKTDTKQQILNFIKEKGRTTPHEIVGYLNMNASGIFRHLNKLLQNGQIVKNGKPPKVFYSSADQKENISPLIRNGFLWNKKNISLPSDVYCGTRDVFQARLDRLLKDLLNRFNETLSYLLVAVAGEIGNNSFDHNLGSWHDIPGIYFAVDFVSREILIADRGQGILPTIKKVRPKITTDREAVFIAFTEKISGRAPEQRGNGLKFVKKIIEEQNWQLDFYSGKSLLRLQNGVFDFKNLKNRLIGTVALIKF